MKDKNSTIGLIKLGNFHGFNLYTPTPLSQTQKSYLMGKLSGDEWWNFAPSTDQGAVEKFTETVANASLDDTKIRLAKYVALRGGSVTFGADGSVTIGGAM